jgi:hypothetical protein
MRFEKMKKAVVLAAVTIFVASGAYALGPHNVVNTVHNLSSTGPQAPYNTDTVEVCVFCHTPHAASQAPLWNRQVPTSTWTYYDSVTLTSVVKNVAAVSNESLMCLSCHDGSIATNRVLNSPNNIPIGGVNWPMITNNMAGDGFIVGIPGVYNRIGGGYSDPFGVGDLSDDHPISFDYSAVLASGEDSELHTLANAQAAGVRFFPLGSTTEYRVECSSCHDPHVDYSVQTQYTPFLVMSNAGSNLCKSCHNK